jgi:tRNA G10  N-methylase Trm11
MKYLFILGRNIELSVEEIKSFFRRNNFNFKQVGISANGLLVETDSQIKDSVIESLGGTISIGEVLAEGIEKKMFEELDKKNLYNTTGNKLNYILHDFDGNIDEVSSYLKKRFKEERLKATEKKPTGNIKLQSGEIIKKTSSKLIDEEYFIFGNNFGRIVESSNYEKIEERDMKKPVRRNELSISPRLAKILINLSEVREGETLLDPFCGIGTILQEALLQDIRVIGIDRDRDAVNNARINLKWFGFDSSSYQLMNEDSSKIKTKRVQAIATEPELGELQKGVPSEEKAKEILRSFEGLMAKVLRNLKDNVNGKIVFTSPLILTGRKRLACNFESISTMTGLKIARGFPINEFRDNSIVGRSIVVMER